MIKKLKAPITIRYANQNDLDSILDLFQNTVKRTCHNDYSKEQIEVWVSSIENPEKWVNRIKTQHFIIADLESKVVGFASLEKEEYLDLIYVHHDFLRMGIAHFLYQNLEEKAIELGAKKLISDVSITAKPFFERNGFTVLRMNKNIRKGVELINFHMEKLIQ